MGPRKTYKSEWCPEPATSNHEATSNPGTGSIDERLRLLAADKIRQHQKEDGFEKLSHNKEVLVKLAFDLGTELFIYKMKADSNVSDLVIGDKVFLRVRAMQWADQ